MASGYDDPAVQRRRLRVELRKARTEAAKTQRDVAKAMDWSVSKLIRIESGEVRISRNDLRALLDYYETDKKRVDSLLEVARVAREESWSEKFKDIHTPAFLTYLGFESSASIIRSYEPFLVPGLLQTEEYAWAVQTDALDESQDTAGRRWDARSKRQELHDRDQPPKMYFILDEAVIRRPVGGPGIMRRQLEQLKDWIDKEHISLQILPFRLGAYEGMGYAFTILEFKDPSDENVLYLEQGTEVTTRDDPEATGPHLTRFFALENAALSTADSQALLDRVVSELTPTVVVDGAEGPRSPQEAKRPAAEASGDAP